MRTHLNPAPEFQPTAAQRRLVEFVVAHPEFKTVTQFCEAANVPRTNYERWCREPNFRAWFIREWSSALLFEGWHVINLARANMVNSPAHFQALFHLLFSASGQTALTCWAEHSTHAPEDTWQLPEASATVVESRLLPSAAPVEPVPTAVSDFPSSQLQNKPLTSENGKKPPTPPAEVPAKADPTPTNIYRQLRNVILRIRKASL